MIQINNPEDCCGCTACANICNHNAISMQPDALGFLYPTVNQDKCTQCGLCDKVCSFSESYDKSLNLTLPQAYAARHREMQEVETSRSGGAFIALSDWVLEQGGVVYGVGYADHFRVVHKRATTREERNEFKGSKYVQSDLGATFRQVKLDLSKGLPVLFSGTPCQTSGLNAYLSKHLKEKLYLIDIVCHGVPSPYIWRDYIAFLEKKEGKQISAVNFRDKDKFGWKAHVESYHFSTKKIYSNTFTDLFHQHLILRYSCRKCYFTNLKRPSDITIADFWGWEKTDPHFNEDDKGCSLIICNTLKGEEWLSHSKVDLILKEARLGDCLQPNLEHPTLFNTKRNEFEQDYQKKGFRFVKNKYYRNSWKYKINKRLENLKKKVKLFID